MSTFPSPGEFADAKKPVSGMAIAALVLGLLGVVVPLLGLVGIILGVVVLSKCGKDSNQGGRGLAIGAIIAGVIATALNFVICAGILLPALGKARQAARTVVTQSYLKQISIGLYKYAQDNKDYMPEAATGWQQRLSPYGLSGPMLESANKPDNWTKPTLIYVPLSTPIAKVRNPSSVVVVYEDPAIDPGDTVPVAFLDGSVRVISEEELAAMLKAQAETPDDAGASKPNAGTDKP